MSNINDVTLGQLSELSNIIGQLSGRPSGDHPWRVGCGRPSGDHPWRVGCTYLIRTVTMIDTGRLVEVTEHELVLEDAAWIADTGRFADAVANAEFVEVEPFPSGRVIIGRGSVIDAVEIKEAPRSQK